MSEWTDRFTGIIYRWDSAWDQAVRGQLAAELGTEIAQAHDVRAKADAAACFWQRYYERVFPLRFGREEQTREEQLIIGGAPLFEQSEPGVIVLRHNPLRSHFLDEMRHPPLLPSQTDPAVLISDHHLAVAALLNVALRAQGASDELVHEARLGALVHELLNIPDVKAQLTEPAHNLARYLLEGGSCPDLFQPYQTLIDAIHSGDAASLGEEPLIYIVGLAAQRIKQYVFESPGLPEIRGASELLDDLMEKLADQIAQKLGPEVILQAAASTLIFLAPHSTEQGMHWQGRLKADHSTEQGMHWQERLKAEAYRKTHIAFFAAAVQPTPLAQLLNDYSGAMSTFLQAIERDRYHAEQPAFETLPFELRCAFCKTRPAEHYVYAPDGEMEPACPACNEKRQTGRAERVKKAHQIKQWLGNKLNLSVAPSLNALVPATREHKLIAFIYGDGSNFGQIVRKLRSLAHGLQWTHRARLLVQAATALALGKGISESEANFQHLPFEVLVMGGDDFALFAWGGIALRFCQHFLELTDLEFQKGNGEAFIPKDTPICFGVGCLISDEKAPVHRTVHFTESELMKSAKKLVKPRGRGVVDFLVAPTAEQIPADMEVYRKTHYRRHTVSHEAIPALTVSLSLRPLTATELDALLQCAQQIVRQNYLGNLQRLTEPFVNQPLLAAMLHYFYQQTRVDRRDEHDQRTTLFTVLNQLQRALFESGATPNSAQPLLPVSELARALTGETANQKHWFAPLWDLLEIAKTLR
ncbi:hypothetical protein HRbin15_01202 [bacterium HR15]|nr:hypothetical protein HRbin15_01202 [bacterium HR15]